MYKTAVVNTQCFTLERASSVMEKSEKALAIVICSYQLQSSFRQSSVHHDHRVTVCDDVHHISCSVKSKTEFTIVIASKILVFSRVSSKIAD